jgi:hypothetical protein
MGDCEMSYPYYATGWRSGGKITRSIAVSIYENCDKSRDYRYKLDMITGNKLRSKMVKEPSKIVDAAFSLFDKYSDCINFSKGDMLKDLESILIDVKIHKMILSKKEAQNV